MLIAEGGCVYELNVGAFVDANGCGIVGSRRDVYWPQ